MPQDVVAQIEKMLEQGMSEEQILAHFAPPKPTFDQSVAQAAQKATSIGPVRHAGSPLLQKIMHFAGITDPAQLDDQEYGGTLPLPGGKRLRPADAANAAMTVAGGVQFARNIPAFVRNLLDEVGPRVVPSLPSFSRPPAPPFPKAPSISGEDAVQVGQQLAPKLPQFSPPKAPTGPFPQAPSITGQDVIHPRTPYEPPIERLPDFLREWLAESLKGTANKAESAAGLNPEFPFYSSELPAEPPPSILRIKR